MRVCATCNKPEGKGPDELRPYGKGGSLICFACACEKTAIAITESKFRKRLTEGTDILTPNGPKPAPKA